MKLQRTRTFLIIVLGALAIYQASLLWFENITSFFPHNFLSPWRAPAINGDISPLAVPFRIISGTGNGDFSIDYSNLDVTRAMDYCGGIIAETLESAEFAERGTLTYMELLTRPSYVLEYAVPVPPSAFAAAVEQRAALLTSHNVQAFSTIVIQPNTDSGAQIYFLTDTESFHFTLDNTGAHVISPPQEDSAKYRLVDGSFAAEWHAAAYQPVKVTNPYLHTYGDKLISHIKTCVEVFFENPAAISENTNGADEVLMTFSDADTVVRYHQNDILEYSNYRVPNTGVPSAFASDYAAALAFVNADAFIVNEFYLSGYEESGEQRIFRFDYVINNYPLLMTDGGHAIEVVIEHGQTMRYKKLVYNFHIISKDELTIEDSFIYPGGSDIVPVLGYPIFMGNETLALDFINRY